MSALVVNHIGTLEVSMLLLLLLLNLHEVHCKRAVGMCNTMQWFREE